MPWIFGYPCPFDFLLQYAKARHFYADDDVEGSRRAYCDILTRAGISQLGFSVSLKLCWVDDDTQSVLALYTDDEACSARSAERRRLASSTQMPPEDTIARLAFLLGHLRPPRWYRLADGSWTPEDGKLWNTADEASSDSDWDAAEGDVCEMDDVDLSGASEAEDIGEADVDLDAHRAG